MMKLATALVIGSAALFVSAPVFANQQGGPAPTNPVPHAGAYVNWNKTVEEPYIAPGDQPTISVHALTGGPRTDPADETNQGRFTGTTS
ncbi:MAG TPA: hypothetical protein VGG27_12475 [Magnetospirillaceae bacterium]|jgi:hypothetical protein